MSETSAYFASLSRALNMAGECSPRLVIDRTRLDQNVDAIAAAAKDKNLRLVDKSLPSAHLLRHIAKRSGARDFMSFHWPLVIQTARAFPDCSILIGKPLPSAAVGKIVNALAGGGFDPARQITWLIDTQARACDYAAVAERLGVRIRIAVEIDIGMRRGGVGAVAAFRSLLQCVAVKDALRFSGLMGYDAHVSKAANALRSPQSAMDEANTRYQKFVDIVKGEGLYAPELIFNGAGSPTVTMHGGNSPLNDVSVGSAFVKPSGFDLATLHALRPAAFIATPILKRQDGVRVPFLESLTRRWFGKRDAIFIYGGRWMATPVWPERMLENGLYGLSSNQQMMTVPKNASAQPGDWAFFRPSQSEAVLSQLGALRVFENDEIVERWPVYQEEIEQAPRSQATSSDILLADQHAFSESRPLQTAQRNVCGGAE